MESVFKRIIEAIEASPDKWASHGIRTDGDTILCREDAATELMADILTAAGEDICTGYYAPEEDERDGCTDDYTGWYYVSNE